MANVLVDGRVFSTAAYDRGMGRYVTHVLDLLKNGGHEVTILMFRNCKLAADDSLLNDFHIRFANYDPEEYIVDLAKRSRKAHEFTAYLGALAEAEKYDVYIDSTPFLGPIRYDLVNCAVIAICYDFIPLKHPDFYLTIDAACIMYYNGLARLTKADHLVCISETVAAELGAYLGTAPERMTVVTPCLEDRYRTRTKLNATVSQPYLFAILGHHKSKNPRGSIRIFEEIDAIAQLAFKLNSPKIDQYEFIKDSIFIPDSFAVTAAISDEQKFALQSESAVVAHLSLEEGFGIPLLEALFLDRKILALDIPINRELISAARGDLSSCVYLVPPFSQTIDKTAFAEFLQKPADEAVFESIRQVYEDHWQSSPASMSRAISAAGQHFTEWNANLTAILFSSVPGTSCGVADYSVAYVRSANGNVIFFFSEGKQEFLTYLANVRVCTHLDFERFRRSEFGGVPALFNFAFSPALYPGIRLMRKAARDGDVLLIHERRYFDGVLGMEIHFEGLDEAILTYTERETPQARDALGRRLVMHPAFNPFQPSIAKMQAPISTAWLTSLPVRAISHLPPSVMSQMSALDARSPGSVVNDLEEMESDIAYVPLGIDDRRHPSLLRAATRLRTIRRIQQDDVVIGHFGLILDDIKKIWEISTAFIEFAVRLRHSDTGRRAFFFLVGKIIDPLFFERIREAFVGAGLGDAMIHSNPLSEIDFEIELVACDAVACFRVQQRGQLSHIFVRALSLGIPVLVNRESGYEYDPDTVIDDAQIGRDMSAAFELLKQPESAAALRRRARRFYDTIHRGDASLLAILEAGAK